MSHLFQVGVGSGGMVVLDLVARDERVKTITLVDPDEYKLHNIARHFFSTIDVGRKKVDLAARWVRDFRPDVTIHKLAVDLTDSTQQAQLEEIVRSADYGICAVDVEPAKFHFDMLMRKFNKPWALGEVLSGGIGGWVHRFAPGQACYGCVASHLQRAIVTGTTPQPDYSNPQGMAETRIPATKAAISAIASLHALAVLDGLDGTDPGFTSMLLPLRKVEGIFDAAYKPYRFKIARNPECLICGASLSAVPAGEDLDVALHQALARLGHE